MRRPYSDHDIDSLKHSLELAVDFCIPKMKNEVRRHLIGVFLGFIQQHGVMKNVCHECLGSGYAKDKGGSLAKESE